MMATSYPISQMSHPTSHVSHPFYRMSNRHFTQAVNNKMLPSNIVCQVSVIECHMPIPESLFSPKMSAPPILTSSNLHLTSNSQQPTTSN